jgi:hypothetical protein
MTFYDVIISYRLIRSAVDTEQRRKIQRPTPDEDDMSSLGSYTSTKPVPKKDKKNKKVEELKLQHEYEIKSLRAEVERIRADQRRLQTEVSIVPTQK